MTLTRKHFQRLWFPEPGRGGDIPSRAGNGLSRADFDRRMPAEFWREVVDRVAAEAPDTLLLAEAFWLLEGYFVRTLGMHRVYNSAFMNMLKTEDNAGYRLTLRNTLEFDPGRARAVRQLHEQPRRADRGGAVRLGREVPRRLPRCSPRCPACRCSPTARSRASARSTAWSSRRAFWNEEPDPGLVERHERLRLPAAQAPAPLRPGRALPSLRPLRARGLGERGRVRLLERRAAPSARLVLYNNSPRQAQGLDPRVGGVRREDAGGEAPGPVHAGRGARHRAARRPVRDVPRARLGPRVTCATRARSPRRARRGPGAVRVPGVPGFRRGRGRCPGIAGHACAPPSPAGPLRASAGRCARWSSPRCATHSASCSPRCARRSPCRRSRRTRGSSTRPRPVCPAPLEPGACSLAFGRNLRALAELERWKDAAAILAGPGRRAMAGAWAALAPLGGDAAARIEEWLLDDLLRAELHEAGCPAAAADAGPGILAVLLAHPSPPADAPLAGSCSRLRSRARAAGEHLRRGALVRPGVLRAARRPARRHGRRVGGWPTRPYAEAPQKLRPTGLPPRSPAPSPRPAACATRPKLPAGGGMTSRPRGWRRRAEAARPAAKPARKTGEDVESRRLPLAGYPPARFRGILCERRNTCRFQRE